MEDLTLSLIRASENKLKAIDNIEEEELVTLKEIIALRNTPDNLSKALDTFEE